MPLIKDVQAREILDSRGNPTIEVTVYTENFVGTASVPSGASTGEHEALELRDGGKRYHGKGVLKAIKNVQTKIAPRIIGMDCTRQREIDSLMIEEDGFENKSKFGANAILGVSLACARAAGNSQNKFLFEYLNEFPQLDNKPKIPQAFFNIINGGKHADNKLSIQEFMIAPNFNSFKKNLQVASEVYHTLKKMLKLYGKGATNVGDEGGFAPVKLSKTSSALDLIKTAIGKAGYSGKVNIAMDCAASEFYSRGKYYIDGKRINSEQLLNYYLKLVKKYKIVSIEDPFHQDDFASFALLREKGDKNGLQVVGDDLTVTNPKRIQLAINEKSCNCLLLKVNQIGTLTEAIDAAKLAKDHNWKIMVSHRSGETEDTFIADLVVALGCGQIKSGAPCRGERTAKYNQLLQIEELIQKK